jgi:hypothetical protein
MSPWPTASPMRAHETPCSWSRLIRRCLRSCGENVGAPAARQALAIAVRNLSAPKLSKTRRPGAPVHGREQVEDGLECSAVGGCGSRFASRGSFTFRSRVGFGSTFVEVENLSERGDGLTDAFASQPVLVKLRDERADAPGSKPNRRSQAAVKGPYGIQTPLLIGSFSCSACHSRATDRARSGSSGPSSTSP